MGLGLELAAPPGRPLAVQHSQRPDGHAPRPPSSRSPRAPPPCEPPRAPACASQGPPKARVSRSVEARVHAVWGQVLLSWLEPSVAYSRSRACRSSKVGPPPPITLRLPSRLPSRLPAFLSAAEALELLLYLAAASAAWLGPGSVISGKVRVRVREWEWEWEGQG